MYERRGGRQQICKDYNATDQEMIIEVEYEYVHLSFGRETFSMLLGSCSIENMVKYNSVRTLLIL